MPWLINATQLDKFRKSQKNVVILDATWHPHTEDRDPKLEFLAGHISGARFLNLNSFNDMGTSLPNMLIRDEATISAKVGELGITNEHKIIIYDNSSHHSSCRALWMFKVFGHNPNLLYILDGGYSAWQKYGGKSEEGEARNVSPKLYPVTFQAQCIRTLVQMKNNLHHPSEQVVDLRHPVRYAGGPEPRPHLRQGHIPGSFSFPFTTMFDAEGKWKPIERIRKQLMGIGVCLDAPIISTCGSGMTAPILNVALDFMNQTEHSLYDGSWSEWGAESLYPGEENLNERPVQRSIDVNPHA